MKLEIDEYEICNAPRPVREWLATRMFNLDSDDAKLDALVVAVDPSEPYQTLQDDAAEKEVAAVTSAVDRGFKKAKDAKATKAAKPVEEVPATPTAQEVMARAMEFAKNFDEDALKSLLDKMGAKRLSQIPEDKRASFLAEISTYQG